jgi:hypothetical protein
MKEMSKPAFLCVVIFFPQKIPLNIFFVFKKKIAKNWKFSKKFIIFLLIIQASEFLKRI